MAKKLINEKIITKHDFSIEGTLNLDNLTNDVFLVEVEEIGEVDIKEYLDKFNGKYVKITLTDKVEEVIE